MYSKAFIINNVVVSKWYGGLRMARIEFMKKHTKMNIDVLPTISTGNKLTNHKIIADLADGKLEYEDVVKKYLN